MAGPALAATLLILSALVGDALGTVSDWRNYLVVHAFRAGAATVADLRAADTFSLWVSLPGVVVYIAAGVVFLVWLWRARCNAKLWGGRASHRRSQGWVVGGWFAPVANLWIPYHVVTDIWRASAERRPAPRGPVTAWWATYVAGAVLSRSLGQFYLAKKITESGLRDAAVLSTLCSVLDVVAGVLITVILNRITAWQTRRSPQQGA
ncbi:DUF4328 domain-containing protein [Streptomyces sp. NPDC059080]|uniref:DUF4328 domain-containing protein n=1 Tax=Streptomyces sp. NPDC059080 TaxID=3346718 RepID=UPI0036C1322D